MGKDDIKAIETEIWEEHGRIDKEEYAERRIVMKEHTAKWNAIKDELYKRCGRGTGHSYRTNYGYILGSDMNGTYPSFCSHCGHSGPRV